MRGNRSGKDRENRSNAEQENELEQQLLLIRFLIPVSLEHTYFAIHTWPCLCTSGPDTRTLVL